MQFALITLLAVTTFLARALPRVLLPDVYSSDTYFHLYRAQTIRDNHFRLTKTLPRIVLPHENSYPFLYHYLLAIFPGGARVWAERLTGAVFDTFNVLLVYLFSNWLFLEQASLEKYQFLPIWVAALFSFSPALLRIGSGPRAYNGSPRVMGQTLYLLHIFSAVFFYETGNIIALTVSIVAGAAIYITAKFGVQVLLFFGVFFALGVSPLYAPLILLSFFVSHAVTFGDAGPVIRGSLRHSLFYVKHLQRVFLFPHVRSFKQYIIGCGGAVLSLITLRLKGALFWFYREQYFLHLFVTVFPQFAVLLLFMQRLGRLYVPFFLLAWSAAALVCFFLTKLRPLMFLGEGERYLEYALFPSVFVAVLLLYQTPELLCLWLAYSLLSMFFYLYDYHSSYFKLNRDYHQILDIFGKLNSLQSGVIWPIGSFHWQALFHTRFPVLIHGCNIDERVLSKEEFMLVYGNYPYPSNNFRSIIEKYNVKYIVSDQSSLEYYVKQFLDDPEGFRAVIDVLWQNSSLLIAQVKRV